MDMSHRLQKMGLTNTDVGDLRDYQDRGTPDPKGTWCSSFQCSKGCHCKRGKLVHVGGFYLSKCPRCGERDRIFHDTVTQAQRVRFKKESVYEVQAS